MQELRANTAVDVLIGPFLDSTDGVTAETALTISQADVRLSKNGQNIAQKNDATAAAHDELGLYNCELDATDTNTLGTLVLNVQESGALPVRHEYMVLTEAAWDAKYADAYVDVDAGTAQAGAAGTITLATSASTTADTYNGMMVYIYGGAGAGQSRIIHDYSAGRVASIAPNWTTTPDGTSTYRLVPMPPANTSSPAEVNVTQISGDGLAADNAESFFDGTGYAGTGNTIPTVTTLTGHTAQTGDNYARLGAPAGASVSADIAANQTDLNTIITNIAALNNLAASDILTTALTESYGTDGSALTLSQLLYLIYGLLGDFDVSGTTLTVRQLDGTTAAATFTLDSSSAPTDITRAT